jgi:hypothetical protein
MINLDNLSKDAKKILDDAYPLRQNWDNKDFQEAYKNFMKETDFQYKELGFNGFQVAMKRYKTAKTKGLLKTPTLHPKYKTIEDYCEHKRKIDVHRESYEG